MRRRGKAEEEVPDAGVRRKKLVVKEAVKMRCLYHTPTPPLILTHAPTRLRECCAVAHGWRGSQARVGAAHDRAKDSGRRRAPSDARNLGRTGGRGEGPTRMLRVRCAPSHPGCAETKPLAMASRLALCGGKRHTLRVPGEPPRICVQKRAALQFCSPALTLLTTRHLEHVYVYC
jgi:hypothetical protein